MTSPIPKNPFAGIRSSVICLLFLIIFQSFSSGQNSSYNEFSVKSMLPTSPEAATLGRFGEIPIGYYTGTTDISIPFYTIKEAGIEIPIVLKYHNGGTKVSDQATNVGLGWSLEPGGAIIQVVNGTEDKFDVIASADSTGYAYLKSRMVTGAYTQNAEVGDAMWQCGPGFGTCLDGGGLSIQDSYTTLSRAVLGDGQPDIYQYNFPGFSGKFYINPETKKPVLIDQKTKIDFVQLNDSSWLATTLDGNKFYFSALETASTYIVTKHTGHTWKLSQIVFNTGKTINFNYTQGHYEWTTFSQTYHDAYQMSLNPSGEYGVKIFSDVSQHSTQNLTLITASDVTIRFNLEARSDLDIAQSDSSKRIASVDIIDPINNKKIKSFKLSYTYFPYCTTGGNYGQSTDSLTTTQLDILGKRLRLDSVQEFGYLNDSTSKGLPPYQFLYDSTITLPLKTSAATDFWGYYNGQANSTFMPDLSFFHYSLDSAYKSIPLTLLNAYYFPEANRIPDTSKIAGGLLKRIIYPLGGFTDFGYESNSFSNKNYPDQSKLNATMKTVSIEDQNLGTSTSTGHIVFHDSVLVRFTNIINKGVPLQGLGFNDLKASTITFVKIVSGSPTILKTWQMANSDSTAFNANNGVFTWAEEMKVPYNSSAYYVVSVSLPDGLGAQNTYDKTAFVSSSIIYYDTAGANIKISYGGGLRVASIKNYTSKGNLASTKVLSYNNADPTSSGILMSPLQYIYPRILWFSSSPPGNTNCVNDQYSVDTTWFMTAESAVPFSDGASGSIVGYSKVEEMNVTPGGSNNGKRTYYYNNHASKFKLNNPDDPDLTNGLISQEVIQTSSLDTVQETNYYYTDLDTSQVSYTGIKMFSNFIGLDQCEPPSYLSPYPTYKYEIDFYPITSRWLVPQQKVTKIYSGLNTLISSENYYYNAIGQQIKTESYDSRGQKRTQLAVYANDTTGTQATLLKDSSLYNDPIVERSLVNNKESERIENIYGVQDNMLVKTDIKRSFRGNPSFTDVSFHYAPFKSIDQVTQKGINTTLVWSDDQSQILAECLNAVHTDVAYTSFEKNSSGSWSIASTVRDSTTTAFTGQQSYDLSNGNISKTGLVSGNHYIISYWSLGGAKTVSGASGSYTNGKTINGWTYYEHALTASSTTITLSGSGLIDELRLYAQGASMTSYTHYPLVGINSASDENGLPTYYEYDALGRLKNVRDFQGNLVKNYQYNEVNSCGDSCFVLPMKTFSSTGTLSYPVGVFNVNGKLLGNATNQAGYVTLWMSDTADSHTGTLTAGTDTMQFHLKINAGRIVPPAVTGCRFFQYDFTYNTIDFNDLNGCYIDLGDSTGLRIGFASGAPHYSDLVWDTIRTNLRGIGFYSSDTHSFVENFYNYKYPDTLKKVLTIYHNDGNENPAFSNYTTYSFFNRLRNVRGNFPQNMQGYNFQIYTQPSVLSIDSIRNWYNISTVLSFVVGTSGSGTLIPHFAQNFMTNNRGLRSIENADLGDSLKLSVLKSDWNTYFKDLQSISIDNINWNREDLSSLKQLTTLFIDDWYPSSPPLSSAQIDNILNQVAAGAGQVQTNGMILIASRGADNRTSASDAAVSLLESKGWWITIEHY